MQRRAFLKVAGVGGAAAASLPICAMEESKDPATSAAILVDLTRCIGCRTCEYVCAEAHGLPEPTEEPEATDGGERRPTDRRWTAVSRHDTSRGEVFVKRQCMHCLEPACAAACLTKAMEKTEEGPVIWNANKCMGCRYCMVSCPFDMPKFEYHSAVPKIQKCRMCFERLEEGQLPACVENCPGEALTFGRRDELIAEARRRINDEPDGYVSTIYGEHDAGGTGWLYLSPVPFEELNFPTHLGTVAFPEYTRNFLTAVPVVLIMWPAFLMALRRATVRDGAESEA